MANIPAYDQKSTVLYQLVRQAPTKTEGGINVLQLIAKTIQASAAAKLPPAVSMVPGKQLITKAYELYTRDKTADQEAHAITDEEQKNRISEWQNASRILSEAIIHIFQQWIAHRENGGKAKENGEVEVTDNATHRGIGAKEGVAQPAVMAI